MNLEEDILWQTGQSYWSISDSSSRVSHFFSTFKPILVLVLCNQVNTQSLNIVQLLNFSLLHNDYVIWLNNVHRIKSEKILSLHQKFTSGVKRSPGTLWTTVVCAELTSLGQKLLRWTNGSVFCPRERWFCLPTRHEIRHKIQKWAKCNYIRCSCFYRKTLHSFIYEKQTPAHREHSSFRQRESANTAAQDPFWHALVRINTDSIIIPKLIIISKFLRNADQQ